MSTCKCETAVIFTHSPTFTRLTGGRWCRGAALVSELLQRVDSHVEVDVLAATPLIRQLLLFEGLNPSQITSSRTPLVRTGWDWRPATVCRGEGSSYQLKGVFLRGAKLDTLVDEGFQVALADVGGNFGPKLGGDDGPLQEAALQRWQRGVNDGSEGRDRVKCGLAVTYLGGGHVSHPLLCDSGCGLRHHASGSLGFDSWETLAVRRHSAGV